MLGFRRNRETLPLKSLALFKKIRRFTPRTAPAASTAQHRGSIQRLRQPILGLFPV